MRELAGAPALPPVTESDLGALPTPVGRYLRVAGVIGQPRVANFRVRMHGRIRNSAGARWMPLQAEQHNVVERRSRLFYLTGSMFGVPVRGYHRYVGGSASMDIRLAGLVSVAHVTGEELFQSETVTFLNDMCLFAPAALLDPALVWSAIDARTVGVRFTNAGVTVRAQLSFKEAGELIDFVSDDRYQTSSDGKRTTRRRWSTPVKQYRPFGPVHLAGAGEGRWHMETGSFSYIELEVDDVQYNVALIDRAGTSEPGRR
jgi:hypothetical protein